jgi:type II secretory pathway component GspD/PulD (secretin)
MSRKLTAMVFFIVSLVMISWSIGVVAEEKAHKSKEAQIHQVREQMKELEYALERERNEEKAAKLKETLQERRKKLDRLMGEVRKSKKPSGEFPEIQEKIRRARGNLEELRSAVKALKEEGESPEKLKEMQDRLAQEERKLVELNTLLEKRRAGARQKKEKPRTKLMFFPLEHANARNLSGVIQKFLTPSGIIVADPDTNILVIKDTPNALEIASVIVKRLDIPRRRIARERPHQQREGAERGEVFFGKVLEAGKRSLTIKTRDLGETVTLYVPLRKKEDGTSTPYEELSIHVASFKVGTPVKVQWRQGEDKRWIQRVTKIEE